MKIHPMGAEFFFMRKKGRTDMTKLIVTFRNFAKAPHNNIFGTYNAVCKTAKKIMMSVTISWDKKKEKKTDFIA